MISGFRKYVCSTCGNELTCAVSEVTIMGPAAPITMALFPRCLNETHAPKSMEEAEFTPASLTPRAGVADEDLGVPS